MGSRHYPRKTPDDNPGISNLEAGLRGNVLSLSERVSGQVLIKVQERLLSSSRTTLRVKNLIRSQEPQVRDEAAE